MSFSVLMSVYVREKPEYLEKALLSVIQQTLPPDEIVLVEDGRLSNELYNVIDRVAKQYDGLRTYKFDENVKLGRALAKGVEICKNDLIARMDADDISLETRFELQYEFMKNNEKISAVGTYIEEFCDTNDYSRVKLMPIGIKKILQYARYRNPLNHMTVMFRKQAVLSVGNYRHFPFLEDYELWTRMLNSGFEIANMPQVLVRARVNEETYRRRGGKEYFEQYKLLRKEQYLLGFLNIKEYIFALCFSFGMTLQPVWLRRLLYQKVLRKQ